MSPQLTTDPHPFLPRFERVTDPPKRMLRLADGSLIEHPEPDNRLSGGPDSDFTQKRFRVGKERLRRGYLKGTARPWAKPPRTRATLWGLRNRQLARGRPLQPIPRAVAAGVTVLDDFEDGGITEYSGDTGSFAAAAAAAQEGNYGLHNTAQGSILIYRTDLTVQQGKTYKWWMNVATKDLGTAARFAYGFQDTSNYYRAVLNWNVGELRIVKVLAGTPSVLDSVAVTIAEATWYQFTLVWASGGQQTLTWSGGAEQAQATDTAWSSGGFGWDGGLSAIGTDEAYWDYLTEE